MRDRIITILIMFTVLFSPLFVNAAYVYENKDGAYQTDVDKFIPQSGVKVKTSKLADMMENSTRNAMEGNNTNRERKPQQVEQQNGGLLRVNSNNPNRRSYKWF